MKNLKLKTFRASRDLTQTEIANKIGCDLCTYANVERGRYAGTVSFWKAFQTAFDIPDAEMWNLMKRG